MSEILDTLTHDAVERIAAREREQGLDPSQFESLAGIDPVFHAADLQDEMQRALDTLEYFREKFGNATPEVEQAVEYAAYRYEQADASVREMERANLQVDYIDPAITGDRDAWYSVNEYDLGLRVNEWGQGNQAAAPNARALWVDSIAIWHNNVDGSAKCDRSGNPYATISVRVDGHQFNANCFPLNPGMRNMLPLFDIPNGRVCRKRTLIRWQEVNGFWNIVELYVDRA